MSCFSSAGRDDSGIRGSKKYRFGRTHIGIYVTEKSQNQKMIFIIVKECLWFQNIYTRVKINAKKG